MEREYMQKKDNNVDIDDLFKMKVTMIIYFTCYYMYNELIHIEYHVTLHVYLLPTPLSYKHMYMYTYTIFSYPSGIYAEFHYHSNSEINEFDIT